MPTIRIGKSALPHVTSAEDHSQRALYRSKCQHNNRYQSRRAAITAFFAEEAYVENETQHQLIHVVKGTEIASDDRVPRITLNSAMGSLEGFRAEKGDYSIRTMTLTTRFWVEGSSRDSIMEVTLALRKTFPHTDFRVLEFAGNI